MAVLSCATGDIDCVRLIVEAGASQEAMDDVRILKIAVLDIIDHPHASNFELQFRNLIELKFIFRGYRSCRLRRPRRPQNTGTAACIYERSCRLYATSFGARGQFGQACALFRFKIMIKKF
jgi:hypothetical protein